MSGLTLTTRKTVPALKANDAQPEPNCLRSLGSIYTTAIVVCPLGAAMAAISGGWSGLIGFVYGAAMALTSLRATEVVVRRFFRAGVQMDMARVAVLLSLKFLLLAVVLTGAVFLAVNRIANIFALVAGVALVHSVILVKAVGAWLVAVLPPEEPAASEAAGPADAGTAAGSVGSTTGSGPVAGVQPRLEGRCEPFYFRCIRTTNEKADADELRPANVS